MEGITEILSFLIYIGQIITKETFVIFKTPIPSLGFVIWGLCHLQAKVKNKSCKQFVHLQQGLGIIDERVNYQIRGKRLIFSHIHH